MSKVSAIDDQRQFNLFAFNLGEFARTAHLNGEKADALNPYKYASVEWKLFRLGWIVRDEIMSKTAIPEVTHGQVR